MAKDFGKTAQGVLDGVGGKENVKSVVHCITRLRFTLVDSARANDDAVRETAGVVSVVRAGGLYQVVIGNDVREVFEELEKRGVPTGEGDLGGGGGLRREAIPRQYADRNDFRRVRTDHTGLDGRRAYQGYHCYSWYDLSRLGGFRRYVLCDP
ncbi:MAG: PTS transporter subunit EIIB [Spirochaetaceae bacterium]|nr:PTS transporter subunit EIIB [Spirochaetaceae bacterium]